MTEDFQAAASRQGRDFEAFARTYFEFQGWTIDADHHRVNGVEVDLLATDPDGQQWWIECKGSTRGSVPGTRRGDTAKKAVGVAYHLAGEPDALPYLLVTSHLPRPGSVADLLIARARQKGAIKRIVQLGETVPADDLAEEES